MLHRLAFLALLAPAALSAQTPSELVTKDVSWGGVFRTPPAFDYLQSLQILSGNATTPTAFVNYVLAEFDEGTMTAGDALWTRSTNDVGGNLGLSLFTFGGNGLSLTPAATYIVYLWNARTDHDQGSAGAEFHVGYTLESSPDDYLVTRTGSAAWTANTDARFGFCGSHEGGTVGPCPEDPRIMLPEPGSVLLLATGLVGMAAVRRRRGSHLSLPPAR